MVLVHDMSATGAPTLSMQAYKQKYSSSHVVALKHSKCANKQAPGQHVVAL